MPGHSCKEEDIPENAYNKDVPYQPPDNPTGIRHDMMSYPAYDVSQTEHPVYHGNALVIADASSSESSGYDNVHHYEKQAPLPPQEIHHPYFYGLDCRHQVGEDHECIGQENMHSGMVGSYENNTHATAHHSRQKNSKRKRVITFDQRKAANIRERKRMMSLNDSFDLLRRSLPTFSYEKKLSRIETLRLALTYIAFMSDVLNGVSPNEVRLLPMKSPSLGRGEEQEGAGYPYYT